MRKKYSFALAEILVGIILTTLIVGIALYSINRTFHKQLHIIGMLQADHILDETFNELEINHFLYKAWKDMPPASQSSWKELPAVTIRRNKKIQHVYSRKIKIGYLKEHDVELKNHEHYRVLSCNIKVQAPNSSEPIKKKATRYFIVKKTSS